jgi:ankyrin repeat protein
LCAAQKGHVKLVRLLLERGAVVDSKNEVRRPSVVVGCGRCDACRP